MRELSHSHVLLLDAHAAQAQDVCKTLREAEPSRHLPLLGLGNGLPPEDIIRLLRHGAVDVVTLPTDPDVLLAKIRALANLQTEVMATREINRALNRDVKRLRAVLQCSAHSLPGMAAYGRGDSGSACAAGTARPVPSGSDLLRQIDRRAAALPEHVALYVISALASTDVLPLNLSSLLLNSLTRRVPLSKLGPVHHVFADLVKQYLTVPRPISQCAELAMLKACDGARPAVEALRFVTEVPTLLRVRTAT